VGAKRKEFIVLALGDKDSWGYNEHTLPLLLRLVDSSNPDVRDFTHFGIMAFYLPSRRALAAIKEVIASAEALRDGDPRFASLGIGLAYGPLTAVFDWLGRVKHCPTPFGIVANQASNDIHDARKYPAVMLELSKAIA